MQRKTRDRARNTFDPYPAGLSRWRDVAEPTMAGSTPVADAKPWQPLTTNGLLIYTALPGRDVQTMLLKHISKRRFSRDVVAPIQQTTVAWDPCPDFC